MLVKDIMNSYDIEIAALAGKLESLENQHATVEQKSQELKQVSPARPPPPPPPPLFPNMK